MAAEKLPSTATGANIRSSINSHANDIDSMNESLESKADLENGKVPDVQLPDVNIFNLFDPTFFKIGTNGKIQWIPQGQVITPTAPSITISGRSLSAKHTQYPGELELSENNGDWSDYADNTAIPFGDDQVPANYYRFRVKAKTGQNAGVIKGNSLIPAVGADGFSPIDTQWVPTTGVVISGSTITYTEQTRAITTLTLNEGVAGAVRFKSGDAALILSTNPTTYDGFAEAMYGADRNPVNLRIQAFSNTETELNIETGAIQGDVTITIELTNTGGAGGIGEVIWLYNDIEWARDERVPGNLTIKSFGYTDGVLSDTEHKSFS